MAKKTALVLTNKDMEGLPLMNECVRACKVIPGVVPRSHSVWSYLVRRRERMRP